MAGFCSNRWSAWNAQRFVSVDHPDAVGEEKQMEYVKVFSAVPMLMPMLTTESLGKFGNSDK